MGSLMATLSSRLAQALLSFISRLCRRVGQTVPVFRSWSAWLWRALTFAARLQRIRLHAIDVPGPLAASNTGTVSEGSPNLIVTSSPVNWEKILSGLLEHAQTSRTEPQLIPATPETGSQRYKPRMPTNLLEPDQFMVPIGQKKLVLSRSLLPQDSGWTRYVHPEGIVLFYHKEYHIFTEHDISKPEEERKHFACAAKLVQQALERKDAVTLDDLTYIVLNVDDKYQCRYYFVDHTNRLLFWVNEVAANVISTDLQKINGLNHLKYMIEACYWHASPCTVYDTKSRTHREYYPHGRVLPTQAFQDLRGMLNYFKIDVLTSDSSTSPFGREDLAAMLGLLDSLKDVSEISDSYSIWAIARMMAYFTAHQHLNFYGQACARLDADSALFETKDWKLEYWFKVINVFLLGSPNEHALRLQRVWVDGIIIQPRWKDFINMLTTELARYTIFSTVMLAVNFSFLAVPGVTAVGSVAGPIQILIYCSVVSTIASIVFSFGLLNVYSNPQMLIPLNAATAMGKLSQTETGMARLAITHSLPIASLIWSMTLFSVALALQIFYPKEVATVSALSIEFFVIAMFVLVGVSVMLGFSESDSGDEDDAMNASAGRNAGSDVEAGRTSLPR